MPCHDDRVRCHPPSSVPGVRRARGPRVRPALVSSLALGVLLSGCGTPGAPTHDSPSGPVTALTRTEVPAVTWAAERQRDAVGLLERQAAAVLSKDRAAFLAAVAAGPEAVRQAHRYDGMHQLGLSVLRVVSVRETIPPVPVAAEAAATWDVEATFDYRIRDFDRAARRFTLNLTLTAPPAHPDRISIVASRAADRPQPWDLEGMRVRRTPQSLVVATGQGSELDELLRRADGAARKVAGVWGAVVPAVWIMPASSADAERLLGRGPGELDGLAAATDGPLEPGATAGADRIVLNPAAWSSLRPEGRDVVMTHELTHVAVRASTTLPVPLWLSEGLAEYVAYRSVDVEEKTVAASLISLVRREGLPGHLPGRERFEAGTGSLSAAYAEAWLAVRTLVAAHGEKRVVEFYRAAAGGVSASPARLDDPDARADDALRRVLATTTAEVEQRWLAALRRLLDS